MNGTVLIVDLRPFSPNHHKVASVPLLCLVLLTRVEYGIYMVYLQALIVNLNYVTCLMVICHTKLLTNGEIT